MFKAIIKFLYSFWWFVPSDFRANGEPNCSISTDPRLIHGQDPTTNLSAGPSYHPPLSHEADPPKLPTWQFRAHNYYTVAPQKLTASEQVDQLVVARAAYNANSECRMIATVIIMQVWFCESSLRARDQDTTDPCVCV